MKLSNLNEFLEKNALHPINELVSPVNTQRNNFEFAFGFNAQGRPCVGFRGQSFKGNKNLCYECTNVEFIGELKQRIEAVDEMVKNCEWMVYDREKGTGYLRMMKVRVVNGNEHLVLVDIDGSNESDRNVQECSGIVDKTNHFSDHHARDKTDQAIVNYEHFYMLFKSCIDGHLQQLYNFLMNLPFTNVSLVFNRTKFEGISPGPSLIIKGASHLFQHIHNLKFKISFFTFFQTNIEMLIAIVEQIKAVKKNNPYLLDLCCGSLVLGMMLCSDYKEVIGVENNLECVKDFNVNRDVNEVKNCRIMGVDVNTVSVREIVRSILKEKTASRVSDGLNEKELNGNGEGGMISSQNVSNEENQQSTEKCHIGGEIITNDRFAVNKATDNTFATSYTTARLENETINREENITVILDPPRAGVNKRLIKKLRECTAIDELFYISCDFNQSIGNIKDLTRKESNAYKSGFVVVGTYAFDMFAGNKKVEVLYHLRRSK
ncbi:tRNA uracil-5-methyltransferase, tRNA-modifying enzyme [Trachipleistophora hominis]|uniref:tRNA uracil-5-methyltransferase, tRNA-modifying enzyme n=1 Tax=Trachipleistophora hominis TaxID=72359 RepID=L7JWM2_TRAHO|nr:tRNA uracil-5-methyltransferase, tRNA-modifying enzyme [Trachipleistophora hominis]